ncbi:polyprotein [Phytophthora megakarya]|uniref:Polyprotein n=1 Tax=Phytophthora megakarya TaxID=4795 RepID=A0A225VRK5_9STRA|nr:polyprotein [Phytophthora megakarya]
MVLDELSPNNSWVRYDPEARELPTPHASCVGSAPPTGRYLWIVRRWVVAATPDQHRQAAQEFMERELADAKRRVSTPSHSSRNDSVKMETSTYSDVGQDRLPLNRWFREIDIAIASRLLGAESAKINYLLPTKEWALEKLVTDHNVFLTLESLQIDLRLAFEPPQDESRMRADFFTLKQGKMAMRDYVQKDRHLSLEEAFALALREDYTVSSSYFCALASEARVSAPEPMAIDAIEAVNNRKRPFYRGDRQPGPLTCLRCGKPSHRAAEYHAPAPMSASAAIAQLLSQKRPGPVGTGCPTGWNGGPGPPVATQTPSPVLHAHFNATTASGATRLILVSLEVAGARRPFRALLDPGESHNFIRALCLPSFRKRPLSGISPVK